MTKIGNSIFGTTGIRRIFCNYERSGVMFTPRMALEVGLALGTYLGGNGSAVVIGKDIRISALPIEYALISGLLSTGCKIKTIGIVTTPTLAMSLHYLRADCGVMITASHNTPEYIGLKFWNSNGLGFTPNQEQEIERIYNEKKFLKIEWDEVGKVTEVNDINDVHILDVTKRINFKGSECAVIVDPGNGSGCDIVPKLLTKYGVNIITLNGQMDGHFPGRHSEPSEKNLHQISKFLRISDHTRIGIALDGDADRVIFLDEEGKIVDPIRLLACLAKNYLEKYGETDKIKARCVVTAINSSRVIEDVLNPLNCDVIRTEVGDIKVALALKDSGAFVGGENSGTYIWPFTSFGPDSIVTIAKVLQLIVETGKPLKELLKDIPEYPFYRQNFKLKEDIPFNKEINKKIIDEISALLKDRGHQISGINELDGVRIDFDKGWILIRRSGTSPYLRISGESNIDMAHSIEINKSAEKRVRKLNLI